MIDPRLHGTLTEIERFGSETADPRLDAEAVAKGLAYRTPGDGMRLTPKGRRALNDC